MSDVNFPIDVSNTYVDEDLSNFPLLVKINNPNFETYVRLDGHNIKFYNSTLSVELPYEREYWDGDNGTGRFWVKVPLITHASGARIYISFLDKNITTDYENPTNVWDSNYKSVFHLELLDGTGSSGIGTLTNYSCTPTTGIEGNGAYVHYSYLKVEGDIIPGTGSCTIEIWFKTSSNTCYILSQELNYHLEIDDSGVLKAVFVNSNNDTAEMETRDPTNVCDSQWHQAVLIRNADDHNTYLYVDGEYVTYNFLLGNIGVENNTCWIGMKQVFGTYQWPYYFEGDVDEFRYSNNLRSAAWIKFEYHNIVENEITVNTSSNPEEPPSHPEGEGTVVFDIGTWLEIIYP